MELELFISNSIAQEQNRSLQSQHLVSIWPIRFLVNYVCSKHIVINKVFISFHCIHKIKIKGRKL